VVNLAVGLIGGLLGGGGSSQSGDDLPFVSPMQLSSDQLESAVLPPSSAKPTDGAPLLGSSQSLTLGATGSLPALASPPMWPGLLNVLPTPTPILWVTGDAGAPARSGQAVRPSTQTLTVSAGGLASLARPADGLAGSRNVGTPLSFGFEEWLEPATVQPDAAAAPAVEASPAAASLATLAQVEAPSWSQAREAYFGRGPQTVSAGASQTLLDPAAEPPSTAPDLASAVALGLALVGAAGERRDERARPKPLPRPGNR
jgi:hypothetical protein